MGAVREAAALAVAWGDVARCAATAWSATSDRAEDEKDGEVGAPRLSYVASGHNAGRADALLPLASRQPAREQPRAYQVPVDGALDARRPALGRVPKTGGPAEIGRTYSALVVPGYAPRPVVRKTSATSVGTPRSPASRSVIRSWRYSSPRRRSSPCHCPW